MAFQNNQQLNMRAGQQMQHGQGMGSPFGGGAMMPGMMWRPPPATQTSPMTSSPLPFLPLSQSSPVGTVPAGMPPVNQGPHMRLFSPGNASNYAPQQQPRPSTLPTVIPWGAGAVFGPMQSGNVPGTGLPPQVNPFMQQVRPGIPGSSPNFVPVSAAPMNQPPPQHQNSDHMYGAESPLSESYQNTSGRNTPESDRERFHHRRKNERHNRNGHKSREDRGESHRKHKRDYSNRNNDSSDFSDQRGDRRDNSASRRSKEDYHERRGEKRKHNESRDGWGDDTDEYDARNYIQNGREKKRHHSEGRDRDDSWENNSRGDSREFDGRADLWINGRGDSRGHDKRGDSRGHDKRGDSRGHDKRGSSRGQDNRVDPRGFEIRNNFEDSNGYFNRDSQYSDQHHYNAGLNESNDTSSRLFGPTGALLLDDRNETISRGRSGAVLKEDINQVSNRRIGITGAVLKEDFDTVPNTRLGKTGAILKEDMAFRPNESLGKTGAILKEDINMRPNESLGKTGAILKEDMNLRPNESLGKTGAILKESVTLRPNEKLGKTGAILKEDSNRVPNTRLGKTGAILKEDIDRRSNKRFGKTGAILKGDRESNTRLGKTGAILREDTDRGPNTRLGKTGAILKEDMNRDADTRPGNKGVFLRNTDRGSNTRLGKTGAILKEDVDSDSDIKLGRTGAIAREGVTVAQNSRIGKTGAILQEDLDRGPGSRIGKTGAILKEDLDRGPGSRIGKTGAILKEDVDRGQSKRVGKTGAIFQGDGDRRPGTRIGKTGATLKEDVVKGPNTRIGRNGTSMQEDVNRRANTTLGNTGAILKDGKGADRSYHRDEIKPERRSKERSNANSRTKSHSDKGQDRGRKESRSTTHKRSHSRDSRDSRDSSEGYWEALQKTLKEEENDDLELGPEEQVPDWIRCSAADLYFRKDVKTDCTVNTERMRKLEDRFEYELVLRNERAREKLPPYEPPPIPKKEVHFHGESDSSDSDSDSDSEKEEEMSEEWMEELKRKQAHPHRLHVDVWHNEQGQLNDGLLCRCSIKNSKVGIRHSVFPGEKPLPKCDPTSNNKDKLFHYRISMAPLTNFLSKTPSVINHDGHEYIFEGFSIFTHSKISERIPLCKMIRFNTVYTLFTLSEDYPENFSVRSLDLFSRFLFTETLELLDIDWYGPGDQNSCQRVHVMPRYARPLPENGKEILSMNEVLLFLLRSNKLLLDPAKLPALLKLNRKDWSLFVDEFRGMIVTCPGRKPSSLRIDQLDKSHCEENDGGDGSLPLIVHCGVKPAQLSYAGDPEYKKKWREFMKIRHLFFNRPKLSQEDKEKLEEKSEELTQLRTNSLNKRDVTIELKCEGFYKTGIRSDICQHALVLPVLFGHLRFHECLGKFEEKIGHEFRDRYLLQLAFTHASYKVNFGTNQDHVRNSLSNCGNRMIEVGDMRTNIQHTKKKGLTTLMKIMSTYGYKNERKSEIPHNERLEFLGDAVIEFLTSIHLYFMFPYHDEGEMTTYRGSIVQNKNLTLLAKKINLQDYMLYAHGPDLCQEHTMKHAMADCFEALMAALMLDKGMLDGGLELADKVFSECLFDEPDLLDTWTNLPDHPLQQEEPNGDRHWIKSSPALQKLTQFEEMTGLKFNYIRLLARAFCQRNVGYNNLTFGNNQRMEFLGDTIIQLLTSEHLYKHFPNHHEGHLTLLRSSLVNNKTQSLVSEELGMVDYVIHADHPSDIREPQPSLRMKHKADLLESLLGAMYIDGGLEFPKALIEVCFFPRLEEFIMNQDWNDPKSQLQQCCLVLRDPNDEDPDVPIYKVVNVTGPSNTRYFTVAVYFRGKRLATGSASSIQSAEMDAAAAALKGHRGDLLLSYFENSSWFKKKSR